ncbi:MAG: TatD family hydrolase [Candidatus Berkelbacteria bacterium]|nr:MAG: TatD family hydrolase [Candidatus Berkelbacteria bacterium]QQG51567.1 MAG: TatD family hydrolase [Candidatus Berkelbacteria bacterium]
MRVIDTHAHLDFPDFDPDRDGLIEELAAQEIAVINPATDRDSIAKIDKLSRDNPMVWGALGLHPTEITEELLPQLPGLIDGWRELFNLNDKLVAVGEIGLDYYHGAKSASTQKTALRTMLTFALEQKLPVIFHCRDAYGDLKTIIDDYPGLTAVIHCFSGTLEQAQAFLDQGLSLSLTAIITYPGNDELRQTVSKIPLEKLMLETDAPFLSPQESRGKRNDPRNVVTVAETLSAVRSVSLESVLEQTTKNAQQLFNIG